MSVQTEIDRISTAVQNAHLKVIEKGGTSAAPYLVAGLADAIGTIPEATEPALQEKTVTPSTAAQTVTPDSGYDGLEQVTVEAMPTATQATPTITVSATGEITASATQTAGYVAAGTKTATKQLTVQGAQTITPGTANKTIASGRYLTGPQTIKGDRNLVADNIKSGVTIFGVTGSYEGSGGGSSGTLESCNVNVAAYAAEMITYTSGTTGELVVMEYIGGEAATIQVAKNTAIFVMTTAQNLCMYLVADGDGEQIAEHYCEENPYGIAIFAAYGDFTIDCYDE